MKFLPINYKLEITLMAQVGRPKGSVTIRTTMLKTAFDNVFTRLGGEDWLYSMAQTYPVEFLKAYTRTLPKPVDITSNGEPLKVGVISYKDSQSLPAPVSNTSDLVLDGEFAEVDNKLQ